MTCKTANYLRLAWYRTAHNLTKQPGFISSQNMTESDRAAIEANRNNQGYQEARLALVQHIAHCPICKHYDTNRIARKN